MHQKHRILGLLLVLGLGLLVLLGPTGPAQEEGPPQEITIRVPEDVGTIQGAINQAKVGTKTTILVAPGTYMEDLTFEGKENLTLQGAGSEQTTLLGAITVNGSEGVLIQGFTIIGGAHGLDIKNSIVTLRENRILTSRGTGVSLVESSATLEGNRIAEHVGLGHLLSGSKVLLFQNEVINNQQGGVVLQVDEQTKAGSSARLTGNTISENGGDGISLTGSSADLKENMIRENQGCGIRADQGSSLSGADNLVAKNEEDNLCPATLPRTLTANIRSIPEDFPTISDAIRAIPQDPIILISPGIYRVNLGINTENLELRGLAQGQVTLVADDASKAVVAIQGATGVLIQSLSITGGDRGSVVEVSGAAEVRLQDLRISGRRGSGSGYGVTVRDTAQVRLLNVQVASNMGAGLFLQGDAQAELRDSEVTTNGSHGLLLHGKAIAVLNNSQITDNRGDGLQVTGDAQAFLEGNTKVARNGGEGLEIQPGAAASILDSTITNNGSHGIWVRGFAEISRNTIQANGECGVRAEFGAQILGVENTISDNQGGDLCPENFPWPPNFKKGG